MIVYESLLELDRNSSLNQLESASIVIPNICGHHADGFFLKDWEDVYKGDGLILVKIILEWFL